MTLSRLMFVYRNKHTFVFARTSVHLNTALYLETSVSSHVCHALWEHFRVTLFKLGVEISHTHSRTRTQRQLPTFVLLAQRGGVSRRQTNYSSTRLASPQGESFSPGPCHTVSLVGNLPPACLHCACSSPGRCWPYCSDPLANPVSVRM